MKPFIITPDEMPDIVLDHLDDEFSYWSSVGCIQELSKFNAKLLQNPIRIQFESEAHYTWFVLRWAC